MPFATERQRRWMWAEKPEMAHRWAHEKASPLVRPARRVEFPNLASGLLGISDRVLAEHVQLYRRYCDELDAIEALAPAPSWGAPPTVPPAVVELLLRTPVRELNLTIEDRLADLLAQLRAELQARGITWFPSFYLGDGDFWTADRAVSINLPWYLANDALWEMVNASDARYDDADLMRVLRHETGHALGYAFEIWRDPLWQTTFGDFDAPYVDSYTPDPDSRDFVRNLHDSVSAPNAHYAQKHPDEDWAETFAVWLDPGSRWREDYVGWPGALSKLAVVDQLVTAKGLAYGSPTNTRPGRRVPYASLGYTVGEFLGASTGPDPLVAARRRAPEVLDAVLLHEAYFAGLSRNAGAIVTPSAPFTDLVGDHWGSFDDWARDLRAAARQAGDGWALTVWDPAFRRLRNVVVSGHGGGVPAGCALLLALDMHEHSYAGDHGTRADRYVAAWWQNVSWASVESRLAVADRPLVFPQVVESPDPVAVVPGLVSATEPTVAP